MASNNFNTFHCFKHLPTELRLRIWTFSFPVRILQPGVDFPFPLLSQVSNLYPAKTLRNPINCPTSASIPPLFSVNHESRMLCLNSYIPFAYSYLHPSLDLLYFSWAATAHFRLWQSDLQEDYYTPLYPLAMLDRIMVDTRIWGFAHVFLKKLDVCGAPKEIWMVERDRELFTDETLLETQAFQVVRVTKEQINLEAFISDRTTIYPPYLISNTKLEFSEWLSWRRPNMTYVGLKRDGEFVQQYEINKRGRHVLRTRKVKHLARAVERIGEQWRTETGIKPPAARTRSKMKNLGQTDIYTFEKTKEALLRSRYRGRIPW